MPKRIAVFSDGTGQSVGCQESNVLRLCKMLDLSEQSKQVAIYDPGIGTHVGKYRLESELKVSNQMYVIDSNPKWQFLRWLRAPGELGFGVGTDANIKQLYCALIKAYNPGDQIYLFGFSRGAFTVRALAGLLYRCGLLNSNAISQIDTAWLWYQKHYAGFGESERSAYRANVDTFRRKYSRPCDIRFLGVWDTVKSVGYINPMNLPHTRHNPIIRTVRHAVALDECRSFYVPTTWGGVKGESPAVYAPASFELDATDDPPGIPQDVEEVWFPGNHLDVGGGYPANESASASNSLRWMISAARRCGLDVSKAKYKAIFPREQDELVVNRHDEMTDTLFGCMAWWLIDRSPRWDLENWPRPPRTKFSHEPAGPRNLSKWIRCGMVSVHESARSIYPEATAPWRDVPTKFIATAENDFSTD